MTDNTPERLTALGDIVQAACEESGLEVIGFTVLVNRPELNAATAETRSRAGREGFTLALRAYVEAELADQAKATPPASVARLRSLSTDTAATLDEG